MTSSVVRSRGQKLEFRKRRNQKNGPTVVFRPGDGGPRQRAQIDDETLSKLPPLAPGVPNDMWDLYPQLIPGIIRNGGLVDDSPAPSGSVLLSPYGAGCASCPVPTAVDPRLDTPPRPPLCTLEFANGNAAMYYCIWDMERIRPNNGIR